MWLKASSSTLGGFAGASAALEEAAALVDAGVELVDVDLPALH